MCTGRDLRSPGTCMADATFRKANGDLVIRLQSHKGSIVLEKPSQTTKLINGQPNRPEILASGARSRHSVGGGWMCSCGDNNVLNEGENRVHANGCVLLIYKNNTKKKNCNKPKRKGEFY